MLEQGQENLCSKLSRNPVQTRAVAFHCRYIFILKISPIKLNILSAVQTAHECRHSLGPFPTRYATTNMYLFNVDTALSFFSRFAKDTIRTVMPKLGDILDQNVSLERWSCARVCDWARRVLNDTPDLCTDNEGFFWIHGLRFFYVLESKTSPTR